MSTVVQAAWLYFLDSEDHHAAKGSGAVNRQDWGRPGWIDGAQISARPFDDELLEDGLVFVVEPHDDKRSLNCVAVRVDEDQVAIEERRPPVGVVHRLAAHAQDVGSGAVRDRAWNPLLRVSWREVMDDRRPRPGLYPRE